MIANCVEAKKLGIPIVAIVDTNCDPDEIRFGDSATMMQSSVKLIAGAMVDAIIEGREMAAAREEEAVA